MKIINCPTPQSLSKYTQGDLAIFQFESNSTLRVVIKNSQEMKDYHLSKSQTITLNKTGFFQWNLEKKELDDWHQVVIDDIEMSGEIQVDPSWITQAIVYSVFVRFFKGKVKDKVDRKPNVYRKDGIDSSELSEKSIDPNEIILPGEGGTFDDVKYHLDTLKSMGINTLYFNPIHTIGDIFRGYNMLDHLPAYLQPGSPYSIKDYKSIDPELTYDKDSHKHLLSDPHQEFKDLIDAAHDREMYIILDLVFNHTAHDFVFQRIRPEWYLYKENITNLEEPYLYPKDLKKGKPWGDAHHTVPPYDHGVWWEDCAQLNWEYKIPDSPNKPPPNTSLQEMWQYFKSIPIYWIKHFGLDGFRCDVAYRVPPKFWKECIHQTRNEAKKLKNNLSGDVVFIAESYTTDLVELQQAGFTAVYGDYSHKLGSPVTLKGYLDHIYNINEPSYPQGSKWFIFPDSHDFDRAPRKVLGDGELPSDKALLANQSRWLLTACLPGIPLIFNGFEKIEWQPINIWSYGAVDWEKDTDLKKFIAQVNHIRNRLIPLQKGSYTYLNTNQDLNDQTQIIAFERVYKQHKVIVVVNLDVNQKAGPTTIYLPDAYQKKYTLTDQLTNKKYEREGRELLIELDSGQSHIFSVEFELSNFI